MFNNPENKSYFKTIYKYDDKGNVIEETAYNEQNMDYQKSYAYRYNDKGKILHKIKYDVGVKDAEWTYKYDKKGNLTEEKLHSRNKDFNNNKLTHIYDEKGNEIERSFYKSDSLYTKWTYAYDNQARLTEAGGYYPDGKLAFKTTYKYELDEQGNWIKLTIFDDNRPDYILERKIEYYK